MTDEQIFDTPAPTETVEYIYTLGETPRPFLITPLNDYTVSEGLLLLLLLCAFCSLIYHLVKGCF